MHKQLNRIANFCLHFKADQSRRVDSWIYNTSSIIRNVKTCAFHHLRHTIQTIAAIEVASKILNILCFFFLDEYDEYVLLPYE